MSAASIEFHQVVKRYGQVVAVSALRWHRVNWLPCLGRLVAVRPPRYG
jgi:hypothetical protein